MAREGRELDLVPGAFLFWDGASREWHGTLDPGRTNACKCIIKAPGMGLASRKAYLPPSNPGTSAMSNLLLDIRFALRLLLVLVMVTLLACAIPALQAARVAPTEALRGG
jgi:ABC-type antimicrobial peptide transport system permease subunit